MAELSKFGSKDVPGATNVPDRFVVQQAAGPACPLCGMPVPSKSRFCPACGTLVDLSPESLAMFSSGPQFAMMKMQAATLQGIRDEVYDIRRTLVMAFSLGAVGFIFLLYMLFDFLS